MSIPYESTGRTSQKARTRAALIEAARSLLSAGHTPTVEQAAATASISRTTAYRYFPTQREMLIAAHPEIEARSLLGPSAPDDVDARLRLVVDEILRMTIENEPALRTSLRLSLEPNGAHRQELVLRGGRAIGWLQDALAPLRGRMSRRRIDRLVYAIRSAVGIEALVWLCDVAGLSQRDAVGIMKWTAASLLRAARDNR